MKLKRFLLRYYPPGNFDKARIGVVRGLDQLLYFLMVNMCVGIILEYELRDKSREMKEIDLLQLTPE